MKQFFLFLLATAFLASCASTRFVSNRSGIRLKFLGEYLLPDSTIFGGTRVGGLSGIDYDSVTGTYYLISDDRSDHNPARFYTAKFFVSQKGIDSLRFTGVTYLKQSAGQLYPNRQQDSLHVPDPEGIRLNQITGELVWVSEGERILRGGQAILLDPSVNVMKADGSLLRQYILPDNLRMTATEKGPRRNGVFEGLSFSPDYRRLYVSVEEPLYEDGHRAGTGDSTAWVRFLCFDAERGQALRQYAYQLDPVVKKPNPAGGFIVNGVVDILAIDSSRLLVTERSFSTGYPDCSVHVYEVDTRQAEDVQLISSLPERPVNRPLRKKLIANFDTLGRLVYNIEGATMGPRLPNGNRSLLFVADDNFSMREKTQFLLFEVVDDSAGSF